MYKVLLVDDEYMITEGLKRLIPFEKWDMEVVATANHADEALDYVREHPVDIVISDVNMPELIRLNWSIYLRKSLVNFVRKCMNQKC